MESAGSAPPGAWDLAGIARCTAALGVSIILFPWLAYWLVLLMSLALLVPQISQKLLYRGGSEESRARSRRVLISALVVAAMAAVVVLAGHSKRAQREFLRTTSRADIERLRSGMKKSEIRGLLGSGYFNAGRPVMKLGSTLLYEWRYRWKRTGAWESVQDDDLCLWLTFNGDTLATMQYSLKNQRLYGVLHHWTWRALALLVVMFVALRWARNGQLPLLDEVQYVTGFAVPERIRKRVSPVIDEINRLLATTKKPAPPVVVVGAVGALFLVGLAWLVVVLSS